VERTTIQDVLQRLHRGVRELRQVLNEVGLELEVDEARCADHIVQTGDADLDDLGALRFHLVQGPAHDARHPSSSGPVPKKFQHADARASGVGRQAVAEALASRSRLAAGRIRRVLSHRGVEQQRGRRRRRQRPADILRVRQRDDAGPAREAQGTQAEEVVVLADADDPTCCRPCRSRQSRRPAAAVPPLDPPGVRGVGRVARLAAQRADGDDAGGQFAGWSSGESHAGVAQFLHLNASRPVVKPASATDPPVVGMSAVS
jgi:hypothetical protein